MMNYPPRTNMPAFEEAMNARLCRGASHRYSKPCPLSPAGTGASASDKATLKDRSSMSMRSEQRAWQHDLLGKIIWECEQPSKDSVLRQHALLALLASKSFERMVERCEEPRRSPDLGSTEDDHERHDQTTSPSIKLELRTGRTGMPTAKRCGWPKATGCWNAQKGTLPAEDEQRGNPAGRSNDQIIDGHVFAGCHASRRVAGKRRRIPQRNTPRPTRINEDCNLMNCAICSSN